MIRANFAIFNEGEKTSEFSKNFTDEKTMNEWILRQDGHPFLSISLVSVNDCDAPTEPLYKFGDLMTMAEWEESMNDGWFIPDDGSGYFATTEVQWKGISCFDMASRPAEATHVIWFNK